MDLPKGTPFLPEGVLLNSSDLQLMLDNLLLGQFSGYITFLLPGSKQGYIFLKQGQLLRAFEANGHLAKLYTPQRLIAKVEEHTSTSTYVTTPKMAKILAYAFTLKSQPLDDWYQTLQEQRQTGYVTFTKPFSATILFDRGEPVQASLSKTFGQLLCERDKITQLLQEGNVTLVQTLDPTQIEEAVSRAHKNLDAMREVKLSSVSGFFATKDSLKVEAKLVQDWRTNPKGFNLIVEGQDGQHLGSLKTLPGCKKSDILEIPLKILQDWGLSEGQAVWIYPE